MTHRLRTGLAVAGVLVSTTASPQGLLSSEPFGFFGAELQRLIQSTRNRASIGTPAVRVLDAKGRDVSIMAVTPVGIGGDRLASWARAVEDMHRGPYIGAIRRFSSPPVISDLADLALEHRDLDDLRTCQPANCGLKLSASEIAAVRQASAGSGTDAAMNEAFRRIVLARATRYLTNGLIRESYHDKRHPLALDRTSRELASHFPFLDHYAADARESFLYWAVEKLGGRPTVTITESVIASSNIPGEPETILVSRRVFSSHYFEGAIAITAIVRSGPDRHLVYFNRSRVDLIEGLFGGLVRRLIERRVRDEAPSVLSALRQKLEGGEPRSPGSLRRLPWHID